MLFAAGCDCGIQAGGANRPFAVGTTAPIVFEDQCATDTYQSGKKIFDCKDETLIAVTSATAGPPFEVLGTDATAVTVKANAVGSSTLQVDLTIAGGESRAMAVPLEARNVDRLEVVQRCAQTGDAGFSHRHPGARRLPRLLGARPRRRHVHRVDQRRARSVELDHHAAVTARPGVINSGPPGNRLKVKRFPLMVMMLVAGALGRTVWDFAVAVKPAAAAVLPAAPLAAEEPELAPLPRPARKQNVKKARVAPRGTRPAPITLPEATAMPEAPQALPEAPVSAPPLVSGEPEEQLTFDGNGESIARAIANAKRSAVQGCFERELKRTPELRGTVTIELDLAPPQRVNAVRVTDDLDRPEFTACVTTSMQRLSFTGLNEEVSIQLPYVLQPSVNR